MISKADKGGAKIFFLFKMTWRGEHEGSGVRGQGGVEAGWGWRDDLKPKWLNRNFIISLL